METNPPIIITLKYETEYRYVIYKMPNIDKYHIEVSIWEENLKVKDVATLKMNTFSLKYFLKHQILETKWKEIYFKMVNQNIVITEFQYEIEEGDSEEDFKKTLVEILELQKGVYV
jgi:hypothetical protein